MTTTADPASRRRFLASGAKLGLGLAGAGLGGLGGLGLGAVGLVRGEPAGAAETGPRTYPDAVLAKGPVGYWRLGETTGTTAVDLTANHRDGLYKGAVAMGERGALGPRDTDPAIRLDGRRSYVEIADDEAFSQPTSGVGLSVEVWMRPDALVFKGESKDNYVHWLGKGGAGRYEWALRFYSRTAKRPNRISAYIFNNSGGLGAGAYFEDRLTVGEWMHIVACFDPGDASTPGKPGVHIYRDGVKRLGPTSSGARYDNRLWQIYPSHASGPVRLGTRDLGSSLIGALDEVAIYPRALTAAEVLDNYQAATGPF